MGTGFLMFDLCPSKPVFSGTISDRKPTTRSPRE